MPVRLFIATVIALLSTGALWGVSASSAEIASDNSSILDDVDAIDEFVSYSPEASEASEPCACGCEPQASDECCTCKKQKELAKKAASAYKTLFYDNDFSYLCDPCYDDWHLGESLKRMCVGHHSALDIGGQLRLRYQHELGMNKGVQRFVNSTDNFLLNRLRLYANYEVSDRLRFYVEGIYADSYFESLPPRLIDVNNGDFLNLFVDYGITSALTIRAGRQELLYGAQRLVSPLDWANTRRTFDGIKLMWRPNEEWSVDGFYTQFVPPLRYKLDRADYDLNFYGIWATYKGLCFSTLDLYNLGFDNQNDPLPANPNTNASSFQTTGARLKGERSNWLWELQGGYQWGDAAGIGTDRHDAGFATIGFGRKLKDWCWDPTVWLYFDYASRGYNQLFPLAHKYLGFIDAVARSNIQSPNVLVTAKPHEKVTLLLWYYYFLSASPANVLSIGGTPLQNPAIRDFGQEIDFLVKYQFKPHSDIVLGYSHFFRGSRIVNPAIPGLNLSDADFAYAQWTLNF